VSPARQTPKLTLEQEPFLAVRSFAAGYFSGHVIAPHVHDWRQLLFASSGVMTVSGGRFSWITPPGNALFLPAGCAHSIRMWGLVNMRSLVFPATLEAPALAHTECRVLSVTPLLRELILRVVEMSALDSRNPIHQRLLDVLLDELGRAPVNPLQLPMPADPRAAAVADRILAQPSPDESLDRLARRYGVGRRTLERLFRNETGISFGMWQRKARLLGSIRLLAEGQSVTEASLDAGYGSLSAFIAAFRRTFGYTPGKQNHERDRAANG
jgi:AraC-like DNA-binding protein